MCLKTVYRTAIDRQKSFSECLYQDKHSYLHFSHFTFCWMVVIFHAQLIEEFRFPSGRMGRRRQDRVGVADRSVRTRETIGNDALVTNNSLPPSITRPALIQTGEYVLRIGQVWGITLSCQEVFWIGAHLRWMDRIPLIPRCLQIGISFPLAMHKVPCVDVIIPGISTVPIEVTITDGSLAYIEKPRIYWYRKIEIPPIIRKTTLRKLHISYGIHW